MIEKKEDSVSVSSHVSEPITLEEDPLPTCMPNTEVGLVLDPNLGLGLPAAVMMAESRQFLDMTTSRVQEEIATSFARLFETLRSREKQLLRQVDVLHSQQVALLQSNITPQLDLKNGLVPAMPQVLVNLDEANDLVDNILSFGKVSLEGCSLATIEGNTSPYSIPYKSEDYQDAERDHVCLYKSVSDESSPQRQVIKFGFAPKLLVTSESPKSESNDESNNEEIDGNDSSEPKSEEDLSETDKPDVAERRPSQVQHWLKQIMAETETEPSVGELQKNFDTTDNSQSLD